MDSIVFPTLPTYLFEASPAGLLSLALTVILPLLAGLLMKSSWSAFTKGLVLLALSAVKAFLEAALGATQTGESFDAWQVGYGIAVNFGIAVAVYFGLLRDTAVQRAAINSGVKDRRATVR
ncbi:hypothetical protein AMIS_20570 [Actinoplanes missouriensis 431]|uniref:Holin n=1 Tax=Actinoplanes missouriensis (strain ATCC 14538 / DSM 43046 / CBS 188.64 / JCM 3121 / NBRC 102363 / NCIMB 12654 / NRRL B-3342 / UNCC 431) TaxID=512565 RepID=I0H2P0_ACTM4|nr:hypothetical protein [Actinoplanes missouriensis]BAL87277.1 hypothetical protein AMIS_20570 [Actinoplanes missouriensis 431]